MDRLERYEDDRREDEQDYTFWHCQDCDNTERIKPGVRGKTTPCPECGGPMTKEY